MSTNGLTPEQRVLRARMGAYAAFAKHGRDKMTAAARAANPSNDDYWQRKVDPDRALPADERRARARDAKHAHFLGLALASATARRNRSKLRAERTGSRTTAQPTSDPKDADA